MNTASKEIQTYTGRDLIIDLSRYGYDFLEELDLMLQQLPCYQTGDFTDHRTLAVKSVFEHCMGEVVRILGYEPEQALEMLKSMPSPSELSSVIIELDHDGYNILIGLCQKYMQIFYIHTRRELLSYDSHAHAYIPVYYKPDLVVAREVHQGVVQQPNFLV